MGRTFLIGVVGAFRQCSTCRRWYRLGNFSGTRKCNQCYRDGAETTRLRGTDRRVRAITLTDKAREWLAAERAA